MLDHAGVASVRAYGGGPLGRSVVAVGPEVPYLAESLLLAEVKLGRGEPVGFGRFDCFAWDEGAFDASPRSDAASGRTKTEAWI